MLLIEEIAEPEMLNSHCKPSGTSKKGKGLDGSFNHALLFYVVCDCICVSTESGPFGLV